MDAALYARVSTVDKDQNPEVQLDQLRRFCAESGLEIYKEYVDKASATDLVNRKGWTALMQAASTRRFKVVLVWRFDRAFRSVIHAVSALEMFRGYNVGFRSYMEPSIDTTTAMGEFVYNILAAAAQLERQTISQRVQGGVAYAKLHGTRSGKPIGRPRKDIAFTEVCKAFIDGDGSFTKAAALITERTGKKVSPGFIQMRIYRAGLTKQEVLTGAEA